MGTSPLRMILFILHNDSVLISDISPRTSQWPAKIYWGIDQSIRYGSDATILSSTAGIVDTGKKIPLAFSALQPSSTWKFPGTTLFYIASDAFTRYQQATGAVIDQGTGLLCLTLAQYQNLESLFLNINGVSPLSYSSENNT